MKTLVQRHTFADTLIGWHKCDLLWLVRLEDYARIFAVGSQWDW